MRKKESLKYEPVPATEDGRVITARLISIKAEAHLLIDYWSDRNHTGRTVLTQNQYGTYDCQEQKWTQASGYNVLIQSIGNTPFGTYDILFII